MTRMALYKIPTYLLYYLVGHMLISCGYIYLWLAYFELPKLVIIQHLVLIVTIHLPVAILACLVSYNSIFQKLFFKNLICGILSVYLAFYWLSLILLYVLNWVSKEYWGSLILADFIVNIPEQLNTLSVLISVNVFFFYAVLSFLFSLFFVIAYKLLKTCVKFLNNQNISVKLPVYSGVFLILSLSYVGFTYSAEDPDIWKNEPLINVLTKNSGIYNSPANKLERLNDYSIRADYQKNLPNQLPSSHVIVIMVDSFRGDRLSVNGYERETTPFLSQLQKKGQLESVDYFTATCPESTCGIYSAFSSRRAKYLGEDLYDLSDVLKDAGYSKKYILSARHDYNGLEGFYSKDRGLYINGSNFDAPYQLYEDEGVIHHLKQLAEDSETPMFLYLHLMSAHQLGKNLSKFNQYEPYKEVFLGNKASSEEDAVAINNTYDNGILQTDDYIRRVFSTLEEKGYLDNSVVIITGDHGEGMGERGHFSHTHYLYHEDLNIPFLMYSDQNCEFENTRYGTQIDIAPTILDCLNLPIPETWQGRSVLRPYQPNRITFHQNIRNSKEVMVVKENKEHFYKLMGTLTSGEINNYRLYDWYADKKEQNSLLEVIDDKILKEMKNLLKDEFE